MSKLSKTYKPIGTCSTLFEYEIDNDTIKSFKITGGCAGNTLGISKLLVGTNIKDAILKLKGIQCHNRGTSCPDQIAKALSENIK